jgi:hypothetical protein
LEGSGYLGHVVDVLGSPAVSGDAVGGEAFQSADGSGDACELGVPYFGGLVDFVEEVCGVDP